MIDNCGEKQILSVVIQTAQDSVLFSICFSRLRWMQANIIRINLSWTQWWIINARQLKVGINSIEMKMLLDIEINYKQRLACTGGQDYDLVNAN